MGKKPLATIIRNYFHLENLAFLDERVVIAWG